MRTVSTKTIQISVHPKEKCLRDSAHTTHYNSKILPSSHAPFLGHFLLTLAGCSHAPCFSWFDGWNFSFTLASSALLADTDIVPYLWSLFVLLHACLLGNRYVKSGPAVDINLAALHRFQNTSGVLEE
jgi:hypothetical protein